MELCLYIVPRISVVVALAVTTQDGTFFIAVVAPSVPGFLLYFIAEKTGSVEG